MQPTTAQISILRAAAAFSTVQRYNGTLPKRQALHYDKTQLAVLEDAGEGPEEGTAEAADGQA